MDEPSPVYILDSFALLAHFQAEPGGLAVRALLESARDDESALAMSLINAGEMYYLMHRHKGRDNAEAMLKDLRELPVTLYPATEERIWNAARLKATHAISFGDAFAAALAQELGAILVTGDPEMKSVESFIQIMWLPPK